jgi:hypothetical protein
MIHTSSLIHSCFPYPYPSYLWTTSSSASSGHVLKWAVSHPEWTPIVFLFLWFAWTSGGRRPIAAVTESLHPTGDIVLETGAPLMGRPRIMAMPCSVTVISPHWRWNVWVSGRHRSTSAVNAVESIIGRWPDTRRASGRNPTHRMNDAYCSSHDRGLCVRILSGKNRCVTQQWYTNISPNR